jgi:hypothetical protein
MILNNQLAVDSWLFNVYIVHYNELLQGKYCELLPFASMVEMV